jgi:hypothetical protein
MTGDSFVERLPDAGRWFAPSSRSWRPFALRCVAAALGFLVLYGTAVAAVNPRGEFPWQVVQPITSEDPAYKLYLLGRQPEPPQVLILGSSRSQKVAPADVQAASGLTAFNFALADGFPEDALAIYGGLADETRPREIVLGLDLNRLEPRDPWSQRTRYAFGPLHTDEASPATWAHAFGGLYTELYARHAGGALLQQFGLAHYLVPDQVAFEEDGFAHYVPWETALERGTFDQDRELDRFIGVRSGYRQFIGLDADHTEAVADLVAEARADNVTVRLWLAPVHPRLEATFGNASYPQHVDAARDLLASLCQPGVHAYDYTDLATFGGEPEWFFDGSHMMQENTRRVVQAMYSGTGDLCAAAA